jgi:hypothetical protein
MLGGGQDYFNFQPDAQIGAGLPQSNAHLDQFPCDLSLERLEDFLNFTTPTPQSLIDQFNVSDMARGDACDTPILAADLFSSAVDSHKINQFAIDRQSKESLEIATIGLATRTTSNETAFQHGQMTPGQSPSPAEISTSAAKKSTTKRSKADIQDRNGDEKPRRGRRCKKAKTISPEVQQVRRKNFLERNRKAAAKCRSRKKEWQEKLKVNVEDLTQKNATLVTELAQLGQQYDNLQELLVSHCRVCPAEDSGAG